MADKPSKNTQLTEQEELSLSTVTKSYPINWQQQTERVIAGMKQYKIDFGTGRDPESMTARMNELAALNAEVLDLEAKLAQIKDTRAQKRLEVWHLTTSIKTAVAGLYGKDSIQYEALGGKRASEIKRPSKRKKTTS
ncbi:MAG: hypothetical protein JNN15_05450 [Blastocatellia bacterium]|nr:hypothetical protein [Blastocatellia bacterium]